MYLYNDTTGGAANMNLELSVSGAGAGDPYIIFDAAGGAFSWSFGADNSDDDKIKLCVGGVIATGLFTVLTTGEVGINVDSPGRKFEVRHSVGSGYQMRASYDGSNYCDFGSDSTGTMIFAPSGNWVGLD